MINIKLKKLNDKAVVPSLGSDGAACYDLVISEIVENWPNKVTVKYGIATEIPPGYKAIINPRSSFTHKSWIMANSSGIIDSDYRGEWMSKFEALAHNMQETETWGSPTGVNHHNEGYLKYPHFPYKVGDRVTQFSIEKVIPSQIEVVEDLSSTARGEGGFGSTDAKK